MAARRLTRPTPALSRLEAAATSWINANPRVMEVFETMALTRARLGQKFGIGALTEVVRWEVAIQTRRVGDGFKINNNHRAYIARELLRRVPSLRDFLELREVGRLASETSAGKP